MFSFSMFITRVDDRKDSRKIMSNFVLDQQFYRKFDNIFKTIFDPNLFKQYRT